MVLNGLNPCALNDPKPSLLFVGAYVTGRNDDLRKLNLSWNHLRGKGAECIAMGLMVRKFDQ